MPCLTRVDPPTPFRYSRALLRFPHAVDMGSAAFPFVRFD